MDIVGYGPYSFIVPLPRKKGESDTTYLGRARDCLEGFVQAYCDANSHQPGNDPDYRLTSENNWSNMRFDTKAPPEAIRNCNVKYMVMYDRVAIPDGIFIWAHPDSDKLFWVNLLREKWAGFDPHAEHQSAQKKDH